MAKTTRHYVEGRFGQLHYRRAAPTADTGKAPLLLFHMSPYSSVIYENFLAEMGNDRLTIAVDTPGFGNSDPPADLPEISDYAGAMGDLMDALLLRGVDVMGYHTGSKTALELAIQRPAQVRHVVMISAVIYSDAELKDRRAAYQKTDISEDGTHLSGWWKSAVRWSMEGRTREQIAQVFHARTMHPQISWWGHRAAFNYKTGEALPKVNQPVLVLNPQDDVWSITPRARPLIKTGRVHDLPGWSHGFLDLKTKETATLVREFLDAH
jgi:pimeloyl-ACP methyl ester carboxylesterase